MGNTRHEYTLPSGEDIHTYMPTERLLYNYDKALDKPERTLNQRFMRRIGDTATETCTYRECADFSTEIGRALFDKTF
eukprot:12427224-Karenia_brevis.AAC.1